MKVSGRLSGINGPDDDDGWGLFYRARQLKAAGEDVVELTIGEHDVRTDPTILRAMHESAMGGHTGYASVPGVLGLREEIASRIEKRTGVPTTPDNIVITAGGQAALFAAHIASCEVGDKALYIDPFYATYPSTIRGAGAIPVKVVTDPADGFEPRSDEIAQKAEGASSILVNSPNNPTGGVYSRRTLEGIAKAAKENDLWVISDEVYDTQIWDGEHISMRALPGMEERTLVIGSMSKSHAMTGSRVGWICGPEAAVQAIIDLSTNTNYGVAGFVQDAALFALQQGPKLEEKIAEPFRRRREIALDLLAKQNLVKAVPPAGAMYIMLDIRATGLSGEAFGERLLEEERIAVMPGESFGSAAAGHLRVAMTVDDDEFSSAFQRLLSFAKRVAP